VISSVRSMGEGRGGERKDSRDNKKTRIRLREKGSKMERADRVSSWRRGRKCEVLIQDHGTRWRKEGRKFLPTRRVISSPPKSS